MAVEPEPWMVAAAELAEDALQNGDLARSNEIIRLAEDRCDREAKASRAARGEK